MTPGSLAAVRRRKAAPADARREPRACIAVSTDDLRKEIGAALRFSPHRRTRVLLEKAILRVFETAGHDQKRHPLLRFAYSIKTNPNAEILRAAQRWGLFGEAISPSEVDRALGCGFTPQTIVYNGPYPAKYCRVAPGQIFADSIEAFAEAACGFEESLVGLRLRPPGIASRFGVPANRLDDAVAAVRESRRKEIGVSFHVRPEDYGSYSWRTLVRAMLNLCVRLESETGAAIVAFNTGGGKRPEEFDAARAAGDFEWLECEARARLRQLRRIFCEPGQALAASLEIVVAPILEIRNHGRAVEIVVDAGYPDVPQIRSFTHRLFHVRAGSVTPISRGGSSRILGRTCLEYDAIATDARLPVCHENDIIVIGDAGAYDASMQFAFAQGTNVPTAAR